MSALKEALLAIVDGDTKVKGWNYHYGLCSNIAKLSGMSAFDSEAFVKRYAAGECHAYPVPYQPEELEEVRTMRPRWHYKAPYTAMYDYHSERGTMYGDSYYGKMRRELARHLAEKV